jgi:hypothetical protein
LKTRRKIARLIQLNPSFELDLDEAVTTGNTGITGISLVVRYAVLFQKAFSSFFPVTPVIPVVNLINGFARFRRNARSHSKAI